MSSKVTLEEVVEFLLETPIFSNLSDHELGEIVKVLTMKSFAVGDVIFKEGDEGDAIYVLYKGRVRVSKEILPSHQQDIVFLDERCVFGEMAIIDGLERSATTVADTDTICFTIQKKHFDRMIANDSIAALKLSYHIAQVISQRQRKTLQQLVEVCSKVETSTQALTEQIKTVSQPWGG